MISPDGALLVVHLGWERGLADELAVVDVAEAKVRWRMDQQPQDWVRPAIAADSKSLLIHNGNGLIDLREAATGKLLGYRHRIGKKQEGLGAILALALAPDGKTAAAGDGAGNVAVWSIDNAQVNVLPTGPAGLSFHAVSSLAFAPDSKSLVVGLGERMVLFDVAAGKELNQFQGHRHPVESVRFDSDGLKLQTGSGKFDRWSNAAIELFAWDTQSWKQLKASLLGRKNDNCVVALDHSLYVERNNDNVLGIFDLATSKQIGSLDLPAAHGMGPGSMFSPSGRYFIQTVSGLGKGQGANLFDLRTAKRLWSPPDSRGCVFSTDEVALAFINGLTIQVCETATGKTLGKIEERLTKSDKSPIGNSGPSPQLAIAVSTNGQKLASWVPNRRDIWIWDVTTAKRSVVLDANADVQGEARVEMCWSRDGRMLAVTGLKGDHSIQVYETQTGKLRLNLVGHVGPVNSLSFSPDSRLLASGSSDTTVLVWDLSAR